MQGMAQFAMAQEELAKRQTDAALAHATRQYLTHVMGLPRGTDPQQVQQFNGESQRQGALQGQETRAQGEYDRVSADRQSALNYVNQMPPQQDPTLESFRKSGGVFGAKELAALMGGDYAHKGELDMRHQINTDDNVSRASQETNRLTQQHTFDLDKERRVQMQLDEERKRSQDAAGQLVDQGNPKGVIGLNPNLVGTQAVSDKVDQYRLGVANEKTKEDGESEKNKYRPQPGDLTSGQEDPRITQERITQQFPNMQPIDIIRQVILNTENLGGDRRWKDVRSLYPEQYDEAWKQRQEAIKEQKTQAVLEYMKHPDNNPNYFGGY